MKRRWVNIGLWLAAVTGAVLWHLAFWRLPAAPRPTQQVAQGQPSVLCLPLGAAGAQGVQRASLVWSPVLFALPSSMGFSGAPATRQPAAIPMPRAQPDHLDTRWPRQQPAPFAAKRLLEQARNRLRQPAPAPELPPAPPPARPVAGGLTTSVEQGLTARGFEPVLADPALLGPDSWRARLALAIDEQGLPSRVLLTQSTGDAQRDAALVRSLMAGRAQPGRPAEGFMAISYRPETR